MPRLDIPEEIQTRHHIEVFVRATLDVSDSSQSSGIMMRHRKCSQLQTDAEALQVVFDPSLVTYRQLLEFFYRMHDPTTANRQGPDVGTQYRSAIFTHDDEQSQIAKDVTEKIGKQWYKAPITTQIIPAGQWWDAEEYHQLYLDRNPGGYECPSQ